MKIVIIGAHPDDPESGCGGLACRAVGDGHEVVFIYPTAYREGRMCFGRPEKEVRSEEAHAACDVLGVRPVIWEYAHEQIVTIHDRLQRMRGDECGVAQAEAYIRLERDHADRAALPGQVSRPAPRHPRQGERP